MNYKQVQRYIRLTELVPDLQKMVDEKQLSFTPAVEISFIRPKHQKYIAVAIEGQASSPSLSQAQKMRELDKEGKLNGDVIDGILSEQKKEVDKHGDLLPAEQHQQLPLLFSGVKIALRAVPICVHRCSSVFLLYGRGFPAV